MEVEAGLAGFDIQEMMMQAENWFCYPWKATASHLFLWCIPVGVPWLSGGCRTLGMLIGHPGGAVDEVLET